MPEGKQRTVYFLEPVLINSDESAQEIGENFWDRLHRHVSGLDAPARTYESYGRQYRGAARVEPLSNDRYLYIAKRRPPSDFPDVVRGIDEEELFELDGSILEPMYLRSIGKNNHVAVLRSTAGPTFEAAQKWIASVLGLHDSDQRFELRPILRRSAADRLARAFGVSNFHVKFDPAALADVQGEIAGAMRHVQNVGGGGASVELRVSFGHVTPDHAAAQVYAEELSALLGTPGMTRAEATLITEKQNGKVGRESVNFLKEKVTERVTVGDSEEERPTPAVVLRAMREAIESFRDAN